MNRVLKNHIFVNLCRAAVTVCGFILLFLVGVIVWNGILALDLTFLTTESRSFGAEGGIVYQISGSILLILFTALISFPLALGTAIYKSEYLYDKRLRKLSDVLIYGLNGIPSVVFGIFGLILFVNILNTGISWLVGSVILAIMILPTVILSTYQSINRVPDHYRESALSLGLDKWQVITNVLLPKGMNGAVTGLLLGLARAVGETAPIMFIATAYSGAGIPTSFLEPVASLPTHILALAQQANDAAALQNAWGASFVLIVLVILFSTSALFFRYKFNTTLQR